MFPSIFNLDENIKVKSCLPSDHQNPNPNFLFNFPSPFLDEHESPLNQIFFQTLHHHSSYPPTQNMTAADPEKGDAAKRSSKIVEKEASSRTRRSLGPVARRRTGKKDRHSKICTAQGVRDRRMRLSLQVARKFFDLQDMLGYDKASKTIEWLFTKSKKAINDLVNDHTSDVKSESFLSECEVVSGSINDDNKDALVKEERGDKSSTRESREKARARARSRTREKMMEKGLNPNSLGLSNAPFQGMLSPYADVGTIEKFLGNSTSSSPLSWPNSDTSSAVDFMGFFGNWDLLNGSVTDQVSLAGNPSHEFQ